MNVQERFEAWWKSEYEWEMKRGVRGRGGYSLEKFDGVYVSDAARQAYKVWIAATIETTQRMTNDLKEIRK